MQLDEFSWFLKNHDFHYFCRFHLEENASQTVSAINILMIFYLSTWRRVLRTPSLYQRECPKSCLEAVRQAQMDVSRPRGPRWRAMWYSTWLEEFVSNSNTIQTQEDISVPGKIAGNNRQKLCVFWWWFFINISGSPSSFGTALGVVQDITNLLHWIAVGSSRKSIWENWEGYKVLWAW